MSSVPCVVAVRSAVATSLRLRAEQAKCGHGRKNFGVGVAFQDRKEVRSRVGAKERGGVG